MVMEIYLEDLMEGKAAEIFDDAYGYITSKYGELSKDELQIIAWNFKFRADTLHIFNNKDETETESPEG